MVCKSFGGSQEKRYALGIKWAVSHYLSHIFGLFNTTFVRKRYR